MPIIEMHLLEGRTVEQKRRAVAAITAAVSESLGVKPEQVRILITQHGLDDFSVAGKTVAERNANVSPSATLATTLE